MRELFVYWRTSDPDGAERAAHAWHDDLCRHCEGLSARLYRRADEPASTAAQGLTTLMETYAGAALDTAMEERIVEEGNARLRAWLAGPRHVEVFVRRSTG